MIEKTYEIRKNVRDVGTMRNYLHGLSPKSASKDIRIISELSHSLRNAERVVYHIKDATAVIQLGGALNHYYWNYGIFQFFATTEGKIRRAVSELERRAGVKITDK